MINLNDTTSVGSSRFRPLVSFTAIVLLVTMSATNALTSPQPTKKPPVVISESTMEESYDKLANRILENVLPSLPEGEQYWIALAGGPGSGKTTTANEVAKRLNQQQQQQQQPADDGDESVCCCVVLPMDGFHYSKAELAEMDPPNGDKLMKRRGAPWTMNAELCYDLLKKAKAAHLGELPEYCRAISDPVPGGITLSPANKIVIVEGLYLLWGDDPQWGRLQELWDEKWFVRCPSRDAQRERLIQRHLQNWNEKKIQDWGEGREGAVAKVNANDGPNMDIVAPSEKYTDVLIESK